MAIDNNKYINRTPDAFIYDLITQLFDDSMMKVIREYVDSKYKLSIDDNLNMSKRRYNLGTTFLDRHYKILYQVSCMSKLIIPLITHYIFSYPELNVNNKQITIKTNHFIMEAFSKLFDCAQSDSVYIDIYQKLHSYVQKAVQNTLYTDAVMWDRLMILGVTPAIAIEDTMEKLITNVLPKYSFDQNIMNLNTVVIRKSIMSYTLRKKDPYTIYSLTDNDGQASDDDSVVFETEFFDSYNTQRDESVILFRRFGTRHDINIIQQREGIIIDNIDEINFYKANKLYHEFQKSAVCFAFSRYFGGVDNIISGCDKNDWVRLVLILKKSMENLGLNYLSDFLTSNRDSYSYKRISRYINNYIDENEKYKQIVNNKYQFIQRIFEKKNFIKNMIILIINNTYIYNSYGNPNNGTYIAKDELQIVDQVINFFYSFVN
jgi:hypothetical protein